MKDRPRHEDCRLARSAMAALIVSMLVGCDRLDMYDQPRHKPLAASNFFGDGLSARPRVEGTIARGELRYDEPLYTGMEAGKPLSQIPTAAYREAYDRNTRRADQTLEEIAPAELRRALLERGRERFEIHCSVCHGRTGDGTGIVVRRGFRKPPALYIDRLRNAPAGYFFDVITRGFGAMPSYSGRIDAFDRWTIVGYVRALQLSQNAPLSDLSDDERQKLSPSPIVPAESQP